MTTLFQIVNLETLMDVTSRKLLLMVIILTIEAFLACCHLPAIFHTSQVCLLYMCNVNPLLPIAHKSARIVKISILKLEGIIKKISYERRDYESVDEKSLSKAMSRKTTKKRIQALKG